MASAMERSPCVGVPFERKWLNAETVLGKEAFAASDFDHGPIFHRCQAFAMRLIPLQPRNRIPLIEVSRLRSLPIALLSVPLDVILRKRPGFSCRRSHR
jgi:hypothetical protein